MTIDQGTERLRILMINDYAVPHGGAEIQMLALRRGLRERGHQVRLLASDATLSEGLEGFADRTCRGHVGHVQVLSQAANPAAWLELRRELSEFPPDVVHIRMFLWQMSPLILQPLRKVPVLFQAAVYKAICPNGLKLLPDGSPCGVSPGRVCLTGGCLRPATWTATMGQLALVRRWRGNIDRVATLSSKMARMFEAEGWKDVEVMGNGVDARPRRPPLGTHPIAVYAGRLAREKGVDRLVEAFKQVMRTLPDARLLIAGAGPNEAALRALAAPLGAQVEFLGHLPRDRMEKLFDAAWVQVVPSLWAEPFGNVSTEAMMRGTAVIASDVGGQSDIVRDGRSGYLVPPGDSTALAGRLETVLGDRDHAEAMGAEGRRVALAEYSREAVLDRLEATYREMILVRRHLRPTVAKASIRRTS